MDVTRKLGRPSKLTPELADKLIRLAAFGLTEPLLADIAEVHVDTFRRWEKRHHFAARLARARAEFVAVASGKLFAAVTAGDLDAVKVFLARTVPERWGRQREGPLEVDISVGDRLRAILAGCGLEESPGPGTRELVEDDDIACELRAAVNGDGRRDRLP